MTTADSDTGTVAWGRHAVMEALAAGHPINRVYLAQEASGPDIERIKELARQRRVRFDFVPVGRLGSLAGTREHQDVVARLSPVAYLGLPELLARVAGRERVTLVALDRVQHAGNIGMVVRTAVGAGVDGLLLPTHGGHLVNDEVVRAAAGTIYHLPIVACPNLVNELRQLRGAGYWLYGLDGAATQELYDVDWPPHRVLVAGNESRGLRPLVRKTVDALVRIPMAPVLDSLNVAVALGVALFELRRGDAVAGRG